MPTVLKGFRDFIFRGNVVDLAVAVVIGAAFNSVVNALIKGLITPLIGALVGNPKYDFTVGPFGVGEIITALINFVAVAAVVYFIIVQPMNLVASRLKREEKPATPTMTKEEALLCEIRDILKRREQAEHSEKVGVRA
jgi:large conductance mechanosensitive channel